MHKIMHISSLVCAYSNRVLVSILNIHITLRVHSTSRRCIIITRARTIESTYTSYERVVCCIITRSIRTKVVCILSRVVVVYYSYSS